MVGVQDDREPTSMELTHVNPTLGPDAESPVMEGRVWRAVPRFAGATTPRGERRFCLIHIKEQVHRLPPFSFVIETRRQSYAPCIFQFHRLRSNCLRDKERVKNEKTLDHSNHSPRNFLGGGFLGGGTSQSRAGSKGVGQQ
jgi:hypothetical protein